MITVKKIIILMRLKSILYINYRPFQKNFCVKQSPLTPRHQTLKERGEIKPNIYSFVRFANLRVEVIFARELYFVQIVDFHCVNRSIHIPKETQIILQTSKIMTSEITEWEWLSPNQDKWICWEKAHKYYIPQGLFKSC